MKTLIVALNSKYIHSSLAPWYLKAYCGNECGEINVLEFTINDSLDSILAAIYREKADIISFSCYIWNISHVLKLAENLKKVSPGVKIILGGPEVSFDSERLVSRNTFIDYIISGEGEDTFKLLLKCFFDSSANMGQIKGLTYIKDGKAVTDKTYPLIENLDSIPSPYTEEMLNTLGNRIVYFESSRGCPFSCSYCISSTFEGVRYFSMDRVKSDLRKLINLRVRQVKFVDRTFNCNRARAKEIFKFIIENAGDTNFHFEAAADLFDDEMLDILARAPEGLIQFEVGIQTTNNETLKAINRKTDTGKVFYNVKRLKAQGNIHIHLDLIAGLPLEDYNSFKKSFNDVYRLKPHQLQLGFLKMLKGSRVRQEKELFGYEFRNYPPYEVLCSKYISFDEMLNLKGIEELLERYYNSGRFVSTLQYVIDSYFDTPFEFFNRFLQFNLKMGYLGRPLASRELYTVILEFFKEILTGEHMEVLNELLKFDFLCSDNTNNLPAGIEREVRSGFREKCFDFLRDEDNIARYLPEFKGIPAKQVFKQVHFECFKYDITQTNDNNVFKKVKTVVLFNYSQRSKATGLFNYQKIDADIFN